VVVGEKVGEFGLLLLPAAKTAVGAAIVKTRGYAMRRINAESCAPDI
jgi:hypothetical protein